MRSKERIDKFVDELNNIWKVYFPDWRFGQLMMNFLGWVQGEKGRDPFFPEEEEMTKLLREYALTHSAYYRPIKPENTEQDVFDEGYTQAYELYCDSCHSLWWSGEAFPKKCPYCNEKL